MTRRTHLVGAWPGRGPEHAMELALRRLAPYLDRMTDGETGDRRLWVTPAMERFRANPDVELISDGDWSDYENVAKWRVRDGVTLDPDEPAAALRARLPRTASPRSQCLREQLRPSGPALPGRHRRFPIDLAIYAFGEAAFARPVDRRRLAPPRSVREIGEIHDRGRRRRRLPARERWSRWSRSPRPTTRRSRRSRGQMAATMHRRRDPALSRGRAVRDPPLPRRLPPQGLRQACATSARSCCSPTRSRPGSPTDKVARVRPRAVRRRRRSRRSRRSPSTSRLRDLDAARRHPVHRRVPARVAGHRRPPRAAGADRAPDRAGRWTWRRRAGSGAATATRRRSSRCARRRPCSSRRRHSLEGDRVDRTAHGARGGTGAATKKNS